MDLCKKLAIPMAGLLLGLSSVTVQAGDDKMYEVTITNLTRGQTFTPILVVSHSKGKPVFQLGSPASSELVALAESGNTQPLQDALFASGMAHDAVSTGALLGPGESVSVMIKSNKDSQYISMASMLLPTNDGFIALNGVHLPKGNRMKSKVSPAYDAGSEVNDELCANIPGPHCGGAALSEEDGEGYVHIHGGIHGIGDLTASDRDWRNPTAKVTIKRMK